LGYENLTSALINQQNDIARFNMIEQQVRTWEVLDPQVLQLLHDVPRENFVPEAYQGLAFADIEIPLGFDQTMLSPKLEGRILQSLAIQKTDHVLHIGTGSGYFTALLANLASHVLSLEINAELSAIAAYKLSQQKIKNITLALANGANGYNAQLLYDVIVYTGSLPFESENVRQQLKVGGRLFVVLGAAPVMQATLIQRISESAFKSNVLFETCVPELDSVPQVSSFEF
jgi:protein-L-isoaspartate(D-aspartate) O-methyltransferase